MFERFCKICQAPFMAVSSRYVNCNQHKGYVIRHCTTCKTSFPVKTSGAKGRRYCNPNCRPKRSAPANLELMMEKSNERVTVAKQCSTCGEDFYPKKKYAHSQKYCDKHTTTGKRTLQIESATENPYKYASIKNCEATKRHVECSGKMLVTASEWTRCVHCAKMLARQSASISHIRNF